MCDDNDMEGVRLWFYGGTPPLDEPAIDQDEHALPRTGWMELAARSAHESVCIPSIELAAA
jgi:hypothetical protein